MPGGDLSTCSVRQISRRFLVISASSLCTCSRRAVLPKVSEAACRPVNSEMIVAGLPPPSVSTGTRMPPLGFRRQRRLADFSFLARSCLADDAVGLFQHRQPTAVPAVHLRAQQQFAVGERGDQDLLAVAKNDLKAAGHQGVDHARGSPWDCDALGRR